MQGLLIEGDNLAALRGLAGDGRWSGARLAYLDPPFNTGERWADFPDRLDRDAWLAMMRDRVEATWALLDRTGSLWVHCDDRMQARLRVLMDDVLGEAGFVATVIWQRRYSRENRKAIGAVHDYLHVYAPLGGGWREHRNRLARRDPPGTWTNPDADPRGPWSTTSLVAQGGHGTRDQFYAITTPAGTTVAPPPGSCWRVTRERFETLRAEGRISFGRAGANVPRLKVYEADAKGLVPWTWWPCEEVGHNQEARAECVRIAPGRVPFATPKPERLLRRIVEIATDPGDLVLDPFLGSGTTAAVAHRLGRRWVGIELSRRTLQTYAVPRLRAVAAGHGGAFTGPWRECAAVAEPQGSAPLLNPPAAALGGPETGEGPLVD